MNSDLLKAKFDSNELRTKYKNYFVPAAKILIGDREENLAERYHVQVENISVTLSLEDAGSASFTVTNVYELEKHRISSNAKKALALGEKVKIELGYESQFEVVFYGFIYETAIQCAEDVSMQVTAMDVRRIMMDTYREKCRWDEKKHSGIFKKIIADYSKLKLSQEVDETNLNLVNGMIQNGSDFQMVKRLCKTSNRIFTVCGSKVYFIEKITKAPVISLVWGRDLLSFSQNIIYMNKTVIVRGVLKNDSKKEEKSKTITSTKKLKPVTKKGNTKVITLAAMDSVSELDTRIKKEEEDAKEKVYSGGGSCIGLPVLVPGRYIGIKGMDSDINGNYYMKTVNHSFGADGFTTEFTLGGKK